MGKRLTDKELYDKYDNKGVKCDANGVPIVKGNPKAEKQAAMDNKREWDACLRIKQDDRSQIGDIPQPVIPEEMKVHKRLIDADSALGYTMPDDERKRTPSGYAKGGRVTGYKGYGKVKKV